MPSAEDYSVLPFLGAVGSAAGPKEVAAQLESLLNLETQAQGQLALFSTAAVLIEPGCLGRLLGQNSVRTRHDQVVIARSSSAAGCGPDSQPSRSDTGAAIVPVAIQAETQGVPSAAAERREALDQSHAAAGVGSAAATGGAATSPSLRVVTGPPVAVSSTGSAAGPSASLPRRGPLLIGAIGLAAIIAWIYSASRGSVSEPDADRPSGAPAQSTLSPKQGQRVDAPGIKVGDRWTTEVVDHQDARLNNRSERVVQEVLGDRIVTTVRNLKSNYTRTVEYDGRWALVRFRLPTGATTTFAPALPYFNFPASPGATWQARVVETSPTGAQKVHEIRGNIGSWETVTVPAGTFSALKIVLSDDISENGVVVQQGLDVSWYVPQVRRTVKTEESSFNPVSGERRQRTITLIEYSLR